MKLNIGFGIQEVKNWSKPHFYIVLPKELIMISSTITDVGGMTRRQKPFLQFVQDVVNGINKKNQYGGEGYATQVVERNGIKMLKFFFHLTDDYEPYYMEPEKFLKILKTYIHELEQFEKDPDSYKKELDALGGEKIIDLDI